MNRRQYLTTVGATATLALPAGTVSATQDDEQEPLQQDCRAFIKHYDCGTITSIEIGRTNADVVRLKHKNRGEVSHSVTYEVGGMQDDVINVFHQYMVNDVEVEIAERGGRSELLPVNEETVGYTLSLEFFDSVDKIGDYNVITVDVKNEDVVAYEFDLSAPFEEVHFETWNEETESWEQHIWSLWDGKFRPNREVPVLQMWQDASLRAYGLTKNGTTPHYILILRE